MSETFVRIFFQKDKLVSWKMKIYDFGSRALLEEADHLLPEEDPPLLRPEVKIHPEDEEDLVHSENEDPVPLDDDIILPRADIPLLDEGDLLLQEGDNLILEDEVPLPAQPEHFFLL